MQIEAPPTAHHEDAEMSAAVAAVAVAAETSGDPGDDFYAELAALQSDLGKETAFEDLSDLAETDHREQLGVWQKCGFLKNAEFLIAHQIACAEKREHLEAKFRESKSLAIDVPLTGKQREAIYRESFFGTVVKDWRNLVRDGKPFEFNRGNFAWLMTIRSFRVWIIRRSLDADAFRANREGALRGNS